jgi:glycerophosphoryl diester phosphodiesterase
LGIRTRLGKCSYMLEVMDPRLTIIQEVGVDVLEMDTVFTKDGVPVIWHDHWIYPTKCTGDYVGDYIANLTLAQVKTLDCSLQLADHPQQERKYSLLIMA